MIKLFLLMLLMALCLPSMAADLPDLKGNWSGVMDFAGYDKNTAWLPNETVSFWPGEEYSLSISEQHGRAFSGTMVPGLSPRTEQIVLGFLCSENKSITMVDESAYWWGDLISPTEIELNYQKVNMEGMVVGSGVFKKV